MVLSLSLSLSLSFSHCPNKSGLLKTTLNPDHLSVLTSMSLCPSFVYTSPYDTQASVSKGGVETSPGEKDEAQGSLFHPQYSSLLTVMMYLCFNPLFYSPQHLSAIPQNCVFSIHLVGVIARKCFMSHIIV